MLSGQEIKSYFFQFYTSQVFFVLFYCCCCWFFCVEFLKKNIHLCKFKSFRTRYKVRLHLYRNNHNIYFPLFLIGFPSLMIVTGFVQRGTLLDLLKASRVPNRDNPELMTTSLTINRIIRFMADIASGMEYMAALKVSTNCILKYT